MPKGCADACRPQEQQAEWLGPKVEGSRSAAGGQLTVQHIAEDGLAALALRLASGSFHGKAESLLDARVVERSFNRFPLVKG
jgi:hypothetical protein